MAPPTDPRTMAFAGACYRQRREAARAPPAPKLVPQRRHEAHTLARRLGYQLHKRLMSNVVDKYCRLRIRQMDSGTGRRTVTHVIPRHERLDGVCVAVCILVLNVYAASEQEAQLGDVLLRHFATT